MKHGCVYLLTVALIAFCGFGPVQACIKYDIKTGKQCVTLIQNEKANNGQFTNLIWRNICSTAIDVKWSGEAKSGSWNSTVTAPPGSTVRDQCYSYCGPIRWHAVCDLRHESSGASNSNSSSGSGSSNQPTSTNSASGSQAGRGSGALSNSGRSIPALNSWAWFHDPRRLNRVHFCQNQWDKSYDACGHGPRPGPNWYDDITRWKRCHDNSEAQYHACLGEWCGDC